ncbi:hypothetical protein [Rathayibacter festucae]|uniref:Uncharacterized protein n=1 Tax=Rathayibacter festucae DSM 15932 TaxID=1328866 RepID=A0A3T0SZX7_9MICO|nr:hypothetical protein [Rathayibacter festucae]AZZ51904.1 hypothetical protein C1I64_07460 [Rathayibacter festucae DSM 15932]
MTSHNFQSLRGAVIAGSRARTWASAVEEWEVAGLEEDLSSAGICVCGNVGLRYLYTIRNHDTGHELAPIGSVCVEYFEVPELTRGVSVLRRLFDLRAAYVDLRPVALTTEYFSRALLADLWDNGAFPDNSYNRNNGENDYRFLLDWFNSHSEPSEKEGRKIWVLVNRTIPRFVLDDKRLS